LNSVFGAHLVTPDGYVLNNAMASFYDDPSLPDNVGGQAGQRPLQGLLPVIATETNGRCGTRFVTGSADATLLAQVVMNLLQFNQSAADAIRSARIHSKPQSSSLELEGKFDFSGSIIPRKYFISHFIRRYAASEAARKFNQFTDPNGPHDPTPSSALSVR
jgi:gamma-glutamyltranspeptidase